MSRKVFISFLGTNNYVQTRYSFEDGTLSDPVRFIQEALIVKTCQTWGDEDRIYIFCTEKSYNINALDNGHSSIREEIETIGLKSRLNSLGLRAQVEFDIIPEGFSKDEIWDIFDTVYSKLNQGDEIYFDVTHAFRSIPMFSTILFNFSEIVKNTSVASIQYGAFEKLGSSFDVLKMDMERRIAPVIDLSSFIDLQHTIQSARDLTLFGRMGTVVSHYDTRVSSRSNASRRANLRLYEIQKYSSALDDQISTCRMAELKNATAVRGLRTAIKGIRKINAVNNSDIILLEEMLNNLKAFKNDPCDENIEASVEWALKYGMYQQAFTLGQEYIVGRVAELLKSRNPIQGLDSKDNEKKFREYVSALLAIQDKLIGDGMKGQLKEYYDRTLELLRYDWIKEIRGYYAKLSAARNIINHAKESDIKFMDEFTDNYYPILTVIKQLCLPTNK